MFGDLVGELVGDDAVAAERVNDRVNEDRVDGDRGVAVPGVVSKCSVWCSVWCSVLLFQRGEVGAEQW